MPKPYTGPPPILVGYDASDDAVRALEYAARVAAAWLVGKVQDLRYAIQDAVYG